VKQDREADLRKQIRAIGQYLVSISDDATASDQSKGPDVYSYRSENVSDTDDLPRLGQIALREYRMRRSRESMIPATLLGEPCWDILLDLMVAKAAGIRISIKAACIASRVPPTTALRWINLLEEAGLIWKSDDNSDKRRTWIGLSDAGLKAMATHLRARDMLQRANFLPNASF
jgi:DNA-binding MarR family transcriptional regulator